MLQKNNLKNLDEEEIKKLRKDVLDWIEGRKGKTYKKPKKEEKSPLITFKPSIFSPTKIYKKTSKSKKIITTISKILIIIIFILLIFIIGFGLALYKFKLMSPITLKVTKIIPYPAIVVNYHSLSFYQFQKDFDTLKYFYSKEGVEITPSDEDLKEIIIERMIKNELIKELAKKYQIDVSNQEIEQEIQNIINLTATKSIKDLELMIGNFYNWELKDFQKEVIKPLILWKKLDQFVSLDPELNTAIRKKAQASLQKLRAGESFEVVTKEYSDLYNNWEKESQLLSIEEISEAIKKAAIELKVGEVSDLIKTRYGYHIIKITEKEIDERGDITHLNFSHIFIQTKNLGDLLQDLKNQAKIWRLI